MPLELYYTVDRIRKGRAILVGDAGDESEVVLGDLPAALTEGDVLRVPLDKEGASDWAAARIDTEETERRRREARRILQELRRRDPGGDIDL
jgi:hypothetical protein